MSAHPTKVAIVTGGARGIGLAIAEKLLAADYRVVLVDRDEVTLTATAQRLNRPDALLPIVCDVSQRDQVHHAVSKTVERFGRIDSLVNNAGIAVFKPILETSAEEWNGVLATNLTGPFLCTQACAPAPCASPMAPAKRIDPSHQTAGRGTGHARHSRQLYCARPGRHRDGEAGT